MKIQKIYPYYKEISIGVITLATLLSFLLIAHKYAFYKSDANREVLLEKKHEEIQWYLPIQHWTQSVDADSLLIADLQAQYTHFWLEKFLVERSENPNVPRMYLSEKNKTPFPYPNQPNASYSAFNYVYEQSPKISFFSEDGTIAVIEDSLQKVMEINHFQQLQMAPQWKEQSLYSLWILSANTWECRQLFIRDEKNQPSPHSSITTTASQKNLQNSLHNLPIKGTNYYPPQQAWKDMWLNYSADTIEQDLALMQSLGFNTVRVFLDFEEWSQPENEVQLSQHFESFLQTAQQHQIRVIPTLFDFFGQYDIRYYTLADQFLYKWLTRFKDHPNILAWDLKNEPDLDFSHHGKAEVLEWLQFVLHRAQQYDPNHLITIGWSTIENAPLLEDQLSLISFHYYESPSQFVDLYQNLQNKVGSTPIAITEFGRSSYHSFWFPFSVNSAQHYQYYLDMHKAFQQVHFKNYLYWTLFDFSEIPDKVVGPYPWRKNVQEKFGFMNTNRQPKKAYDILLQPSHSLQDTPLYSRINSFHFTFVVGVVLFVVLLIYFNKEKRFLYRIKRIFEKIKK